MPGNLQDTLAIAALVQCLVKALSDEIDNGTYQHDSHPMMVQQNKWRAARFGNQAKLVDTNTYHVSTAADTVARLADRLRKTATELQCEPYLDHCVGMSCSPSAAQRQLDLLAETDDPKQMVQTLAESSRITEQSG
jgi:carboxylate-amine ligase